MNRWINWYEGRKECSSGFCDVKDAKYTWMMRCWKEAFWPFGRTLLRNAVVHYTTRQTRALLEHSFPSFSAVLHSVLLQDFLVPYARTKLHQALATRVAQTRGPCLLLNKRRPGCRGYILSLPLSSFPATDYLYDLESDRFYLHAEDEEEEGNFCNWMDSLDGKLLCLGEVQ
jgi:hypothetical protein